MLQGLLGISTIFLELILMAVLYVAMLALGRGLKRGAGVDLGLLYHLFCVIFSIWLPLEILHTEFPSRETYLKLGRAASILLGTVFVLALVKRYFWELWYEKNHKQRAPKFLSQIIGLVAIIVTIFVIIGGVYGQRIEGVVFGSTIVVGIIGFAMQDLLGNIIAGIALEIGKPFKPGDWLRFDNQHAEVIEVNWRSTRLRTNDDIYLDIPNKAIAGSTIVNLTYPTRQHAIRIQVGFEYSTPPNLVKDVMARATAEVPGVLVTPPPKVFLREFADFEVMYEIKFWLDDESRFSDILDGVRTNIWYAAQRHGMTMPFPIRTVRMEEVGVRKQAALGAAQAKVRKQPFLQLLGEDQVDKLLGSARLQRFGRGEKVIQQGAPGESMFILLSGEADVFVNAAGHLTKVATLHTGDYCGEMSLLTGEPRSATVVAQTDCEMWEIDKPVVADLLQENETLVQQLSEMLAHRRMETEGILASASGQEQMNTKKKEYTAGFLKKLYSFFEL
jgi:small-conductance mechanosensitive channel/CRP-like cAMP-binding protein